jgi:hypothetical protein
MSHIVEIKLLINDLAALKAAVAADPRLEWREKKTYNWYGRSVGDYPLPEGITKEDLGKCDFAIGVKDNPEAYEVGVIKKKDGTGYTLMGDFYKGGYGLCEVVGEKITEPYLAQVKQPDGTIKEVLTQPTPDDIKGHNFYKLANAYAAQVSAKAMRKKGYRVTIKAKAQGDYEVTCVK